MFQFEDPSNFLFQSSDGDLIFLGQASINLNKKRNILYKKKKFLDNKWIVFSLLTLNILSYGTFCYHGLISLNYHNIMQ